MAITPSFSNWQTVVRSRMQKHYDSTFLNHIGHEVTIDSSDVGVVVVSRPP